MRYPIYIPTKGRWESRLTIRALEALGLPYRAVIQPQDYELYAAVIDRANILVLPFNDEQQGLLRARNWIWDHAVSEGHKRHWQIDDNIDGFYRLNQNRKVRLRDECPFSPIEDFADRYVNVALAGPNYEFFVLRRQKCDPVRFNTRIYSCTLVLNSLPFRYRARYNDDTDLSLQVLKAGWCTVLFNAYLAKKMPTMKLAGGNTDVLYHKDAAFDGRLEMAKSLVQQHPDVTKITRKWGRWQHQVDYRPFKHNKLKFTDEYLAQREQATGRQAELIEHGTTD